MPVSGPGWAARFPTSRSLDDLREPFRTAVQGFVAALRGAGATVTIADTLRPPERVYLMHWAFAIAHDSQNPAKVPPMDGVDIQWVHTDAQGNPDPVASKAAAAQMVSAYGIVFRPALQSRHTEGLAIDMTISWQDSLTIADVSGAPIVIASAPRNGLNADLHAAGARYGVVKLATDPPHWSSDGH
jgi:D-alanyl-D-alanine dipeptidase